MYEMNAASTDRVMFWTGYHHQSSSASSLQTMFQLLLTKDIAAQKVGKSPKMAVSKANRLYVYVDVFDFKNAIRGVRANFFLGGGAIFDRKIFRQRPKKLLC